LSYSPAFMFASFNKCFPSDLFFMPIILLLYEVYVFYQTYSIFLI